MGCTTPSYVIVNAPGCVVAVPSSGSLIVIVSCVPAAFVEPERNVGAVMSGIRAMLAEPAV